MKLTVLHDDSFGGAEERQTGGHDDNRLHEVPPLLLNGVIDDLGSPSGLLIHGCLCVLDHLDLHGVLLEHDDSFR